MYAYKYYDDNFKCDEICAVITAYSHVVQGLYKNRSYALLIAKQFNCAGGYWESLDCENIKTDLAQLKEDPEMLKEDNDKETHTRLTALHEVQRYDEPVGLFLNRTNANRYVERYMPYIASYNHTANYPIKPLYTDIFTNENIPEECNVESFGTIYVVGFSGIFKSKNLAEEYRKYLEEHNCNFFTPNTIRELKTDIMMN